MIPNIFQANSGVPPEESTKAKQAVVVSTFIVVLFKYNTTLASSCY